MSKVVRDSWVNLVISHCNCKIWLTSWTLVTPTLQLFLAGSVGELGKRFLQGSPPQPNQWIPTLFRPKLHPLDSAALWASRQT